MNVSEWMLFNSTLSSGSVQEVLMNPGGTGGDVFINSELIFIKEDNNLVLEAQNSVHIKQEDSNSIQEEQPIKIIETQGDEIWHLLNG